MLLQIVLGRPKLFWASLVVPLLLLGCATQPYAKLDVKCRMAGVEDGDSVFIVSINGREFEHKSSNGGIEFFKNKAGTVIRVRVWSGRGTYTGGEVDHYYHVGENGQIAYLGSLKESWYENEDFIRVKIGGFHPVVVSGYSG